MWWFGPCAGCSCRLLDVAPASDWVDLRLLSCGSSAPVALPAPPGLYTARNRVTNDLVALKVLDRRLLRQRATRRRLRQEVCVLRLANGHPHLLQLHDVSTTGTRVELAFELARGGESLKRLKSEQDVSRVASQVASGLQFLHGQRVVHGEVRPEHILYSDDEPDARVLLAAFGRAAPWRNFSLRCRPTTRRFLWDDVHHIHFLPPFVLKRRRELKGDKGVVKNWREAQQIDVWALGVTLYVMLCGCYPFGKTEDKDKQDNVVDIENRVLNNQLTFPDEGNLLSRAAKDLLRRMLAKDADTVMSTEEVAAHPWINEGVAPAVSWSMDMLTQHQAFDALYAEEVATSSHRRPTSASSFSKTLCSRDQHVLENGVGTAGSIVAAQQDSVAEQIEEEEARPSFMSTHGTPLLLDEEIQQERPSADCFMRLASFEMGGSNMNTANDDDVVADPAGKQVLPSGLTRGAGVVDDGRTAVVRQKSLDRLWQVLLRQRRFFSSKSLSSGSSTDRS